VAQANLSPQISAPVSNDIAARARADSETKV